MSIRPCPSQTLVEVFNSDAAAQAAVRGLKEVGFTDAQINVEKHFQDAIEMKSDDKHSRELEHIGDYVMSGAAAGLGIGALWGLGILAGVAPDIVPSVIAGFPTVVLSTAAASATVAGTSGALIGKVCQHGDDCHAEKRFESNYTIVAVKAGARAEIANRVLNQRKNEGSVDFERSCWSHRG